jgi:site-specific recombinase XerD
VTTPTPAEESSVPELVASGATPTAVGQARLVDLEAKVARAVRRSRAEATLRAYRADWADFTTWCATLGLDPLPASPATVAAYVAELADPPDDRAPRAVSTITRRLAAIAEGHKVAGHDNPTADPLVRETMKGVRRSLGVAPRQKRGITTADMRVAVTGLGDRLIDHRDRLLLLLGFAGGFRRSELVALDVADITDHPQGLLLRIRRSKTDQEAAGRTIEIAYGTDPATCPVRAWRTWAHHAGITDGPALRAVDRHGNLSDRPLTGHAVALIIKRHMARLGYNIDDFAGHSLRRGMATTAARNGAAERTIMRTTGHTATATLRSYIEAAEVFTDPASAYLEL